MAERWLKASSWGGMPPGCRGLGESGVRVWQLVSPGAGYIALLHARPLRVCFTFVDLRCSVLDPRRPPPPTQLGSGGTIDLWSQGAQRVEGRQRAWQAWDITPVGWQWNPVGWQCYVQRLEWGRLWKSLAASRLVNSVLTETPKRLSPPMPHRCGRSGNQEWTGCRN